MRLKKKKTNFLNVKYVCLGSWGAIEDIFNTQLRLNHTSHFYYYYYFIRRNYSNTAHPHFQIYRHITCPYRIFTRIFHFPVEFSPKSYAIYHNTYRNSIRIVLMLSLKLHCASHVVIRYKSIYFVRRGDRHFKI